MPADWTRETLSNDADLVKPHSGVCADTGVATNTHSKSAARTHNAARRILNGALIFGNIAACVCNWYPVRWEHP